ncbi:alpha/beta-hydrolase [Aureobasidium pullulans]|nr:alpha/beta-hydrolase [Aureobasidium pullulans]
MGAANMSSLEPLPLPEGIEESYIDCNDSCGLVFHVISAGQKDKPLILLTHGFPELAYSWRKIMPALAAKGYYVVAPDQRGYGRTTGWDTRPFDEVDLNQFTMTNLVRDLVCLVYALGHKEVHCHIGHDFGAVSSAMAPLMRPDMFKSCVQMSHPHHAPPTPLFDVKASRKPITNPGSTSEAKPDTQAELAKLDPPRKHYKWYNSTSGAANDWETPSQGLHKFLRGYWHLKSADWPGNEPTPLKSWSAAELGKMPNYYIMPKDTSMPETVASMMKGEDDTATTRWLSDSDLDVYVKEWQRIGFQGGLNWYRAQTSSSKAQKADMLLFAGRKIEVPCAFISGEQDWGNYQQPGALDGYKESCADFRGSTFIPHAGHWVQQEQPEKVIEAVCKFLDGL